MLTAILAGSAILVLLVFYFTYRPQSKYRHNMLFAVTLPAHVAEDSRLRTVQECYKRNMRHALWASLLSLVPFGILYPWEAYQVIYFLVLIVVMPAFYVGPFRSAFRDTLSLKRENDWFVGARRVVRSDLRAARLKNEKSAPLWMFLVPIGLAAAFAAWVALNDQGGLAIPLVGVGLTLICFGMALGLRREKAVVYSENGEVNLSLNQKKRKMLSYLWLWLAFTEFVHASLLCLLLANDSGAMSGLWLAVVISYGVMPLAIILYSYRKINALEQEALAQDGKVIYTDDDEYWANGFTYHNPDDKSLFVAKRVGIGQAINTGTLAGKIIVGGVVFLTAAVIVGTSVLLVISEMVSPRLQLKEDHRVQIRYPMYSYDFDVAEIQQLSLVDAIPSGHKTNGEAKRDVARGNFRLEGLGKTKLYIYKKSPPYIQMKLENLYVIFGDEDPEVTKRLYEEIKQAQAST